MAATGITCSSCSLEINSKSDNFLTCSVNGEHNFHVECVQIKPSEFKFILKTPSISFTCKNCSSMQATSILTEVVNDIKMTQQDCISIIHKQSELIAKQHNIIDIQESNLRELVKKMEGLIKSDSYKSVKLTRPTQQLSEANVPSQIETSQLTYAQAITEPNRIVESITSTGPGGPLEMNQISKQHKKQTIPISKSTAPTPAQIRTVLGSEPALEDNGGGFESVVGRRRRKPKTHDKLNANGYREETRPNVSVGKATAACPLRGVAPRAHIHIWRLEKGTTAETVSSYLKKELGREIDLEVAELKTKGNYASFRISAPAEFKEEICNTDLWPVNVSISDYKFLQNFRGNRPNKTDT